MNKDLILINQSISEEKKYEVVRFKNRKKIKSIFFLFLITHGVFERYM